MMRVRQFLSHALQLLADAWVTVGLALVLLLAVEGAYRVQAASRHALARHLGHPSPAAADPYARAPWFAEYQREQNESAQRMGWQPFVYYRRLPFAGRYVNIDSLGVRRTVNVEPAATAHREILVLGGSTTWGTGQRDSMTIPSLVAEDLAGRGIRDVHVTNLGESGYVFTQEVIELTLRLRAGARPSAVVFYDGINDVASAVQAGRAGVPANDFHRQRDYDLGRRVFDWRTDLPSEARAAAALMTAVSIRFQLVDRMRPTGPAFSSPPDDSMANDIVHTYGSTIELVEALAKTYGFTPLYFWQPTLHSTRKPLSPFERSLWRTLEADAYTRALIRVHRLVPNRLAYLHEELGDRLVDLSDLFNHDTAQLYIDPIGHTTEAAAAMVAGEIARRLTPVLESGGPSGRLSSRGARLQAATHLNGVHPEGRHLRRVVGEHLRDPARMTVSKAAGYGR